jgi:hypothetical protein
MTAEAQAHSFHDLRPDAFEYAWDNSIEPAAIVYTFYKQVWPKPAYPYDLFPLIIAGWAVLGAAITFAFPALTRRIGRGLSESEGIVGEPT